MEFILALAVAMCAFWGVQSYPAYYPYFAPNVDAISFGANDNSQTAMSYSRYYQPYYNTRALGGGMTAFMFRQPQAQKQNTNEGYYLPDRRRQTPPETQFLPPQENEVYYQQTPEKVPIVPTTEANDIADPTEKVDLATTTLKALPELSEAEEVEEATEKPRKRISKKKQIKRPVDEEDDEDVPRMPQGAFFPMFFGWGGRSGGGAPGGATAIANAYSTGRGGVASSHATAYGPPRANEKSN